MQSRRFTIVTETYPPEINGVANTLKHFAEGLCSRGHQVEVIRPRQNGSDVARIDRAGVSHAVVPGMPLPGYPELRFGLPFGNTVEGAWRMARPDAVYVATEGPLGVVACNIARRLQIPVVTGFHTNFHQYSHFYRAGWLAPIIEGYLRWFHNRTAMTLTPTHHMRQQLQQMGISNAARLSRGVDCELFSPLHRCAALRDQWGATEFTPVLLYAGRIAPEKNLSLAIRTWCELKLLHPYVVFVLVGDGPLRKTLQTQYPELRFCGMQTGEILARHYASADIFLFPSKTDTFGNVVTEAMASGLAVVAFDDACAREHIDNQKNGIKVPLGDDAAFVESVMQLLAGREQLSSLREFARQSALSIEWQVVVDTLESLMLAARTGTGKTELAQYLPPGRV